MLTMVTKLSRFLLTIKGLRSHHAPNQSLTDSPYSIKNWQKTPGVSPGVNAVMMRATLMSFLPFQGSRPGLL